MFRLNTIDTIDTAESLGEYLGVLFADRTAAESAARYINNLHGDLTVDVVKVDDVSALDMLAAEAAELCVLISYTDGVVTFRPDGGGTSEGDVNVTTCGEGDWDEMNNDSLLICSVDGDWLWAHENLAAFLAEHKATNNWTRAPVEVVS